MKDKYGRDINYLKVHLTDECNLGCIYCNLNKANETNNLTLNQYKFIIKYMAEAGIKKIKFTGGEPTLYPYLNELIYFCKNDCGINDISINTNGLNLLDYINSLKMSGLSEVNISVDSLKEYRYKAITNNGNLKQIIESINACLNEGIKVNINTLLIKNFNDDEINDFLQLINYNPINVRFIELNENKIDRNIYENGYLNVENSLKEIEGLYKINDNTYSYNNSKGNIIVKNKCGTCEECNKIELTKDGIIRLCSEVKSEADIIHYLNRPLIFKELLKEIIIEKPKGLI